MHSKRFYLTMFCSMLSLSIIFMSGPISSISAADPLLDLLEDELKREMTTLKSQENPPYFMSYTVADYISFDASASFGALTDSQESNEREVAVQVRVGDRQLDNTHDIRGSYFGRYFGRQASTQALALDSNTDALRAALWRETDKKYREAIDNYSKVKANVAVKVEEEDKSADFSATLPPHKYEAEALDFGVLLGEKAKWEEKVKSITKPFLDNKNIYYGDSSFTFEVVRKYIVTSEGTKIVHNNTRARIFISSYIKSEDGMELPLYQSYAAFTPEDLPSDEVILGDVQKMIQKLDDLVQAPIVEPYSGPALLSGRAAGVFFHEIFGHRVEGHRLKQEDDSQTFKKKIGEKVLPEHMSVIFDPDQKKFQETDLRGYYLYDDEGVKAQKVDVVKDGILQNFLMSRSPIVDFPQSNGHGRAQLGYRPVARQSNLIVKSTSLLSMVQLRQRFIEELKKQEKPFGLLFEDITGGFTFTGRFIPNAFNVIPTLVYKVFADGRPDELVRGVDLVGTPLVMFSNITEAGDEFGVFNGTCGAESGGVPVSAISPALLVTKIEVQKKIKSQDRPPILVRPDLDPKPDTGSTDTQ